MQDLPVESDSDEEFEEYLEPEDGPHISDDETCSSPQRLSHSLDDISTAGEAASFPESPLAVISPSFSPMQGESSNGLPPACRTSPTPTLTDAHAATSEVRLTILSSTLVYVRRGRQSQRMSPASRIWCPIASMEMLLRS